MRVHSRTVAVAAAAAVAVGGLTAAAPAGPAAPATEIVAAATPKIVWGRCHDKAMRKAGGQCGLLSVPLDHARPTGPRIKIAVSRIKADGPHSKRQGVLFVNPGGPGASGLDLPEFFARALPKKVRAAYDLIGFDSRGVGGSKPSMTCDKHIADGPRPDYVPVSAAVIGPNETAWLKISARYAAACARKYPALLPHMRTSDTIRDLDLVRRALGEKAINFYGFSFGTYLAQTYATLFPTRMRRMVLDGNVEPNGVGYGDGSRAQSIAFEGVIQAYFAWLARHDAQYGLGRTAKAVEAEYYVQEDALRVHPVGRIGPDEWSDVFLLAGYSEEYWPYVAHAWVTWRKGQRAAFRTLAEQDSGGDNGYAAFNATLCSDGPWPTDYATVRADSLVTARSAPFETWSSQWYSGPCLTWKGGHGTPIVVDGSRAASALLVNATLDGATPFAHALKVRAEFPRSSLIAEVGATTHAGSLSGNHCVDDRIAKYLLTGARPKRHAGNKADVKCGRGPFPVPLKVDR